MFNSKEYQWSNVHVYLLGRAVTGIQGVSYTAKQEKEFVYDVDGFNGQIPQDEPKVSFGAALAITLTLPTVGEVHSTRARSHLRQFTKEMRESPARRGGFAT